MNGINKLLTLPLFALAVLASPARAAEEVTVHQPGGVSYVSGGVGEEGRDRILSIGRDFNLKLLFAVKSGAYLSGVAVTITDAHGQALIVATADGPMFFAKLPAGKYRIEASAKGITQRDSVNLADQGQSNVNFRWQD